MALIDAGDGQSEAPLRTFPSARAGRVPLLYPRLLGFLRIQTSARRGVRVKAGGSVLNDLCSHLEVRWLERTSRLVYVQLSFLKHFPSENRSHVKPASRMCALVFILQCLPYVSASAHGRACLRVSAAAERVDERRRWNSPAVRWWSGCCREGTRLQPPPPRPLLLLFFFFLVSIHYQSLSNNRVAVCFFGRRR